MISPSVVQNLARKLQTTELNIRREYIQNLFLSYFYRQSESGRVYFKGGTALRIIYGSPRFSEDLDFSTPQSDIHKIENVLLQTIREIEREGIRVDIKESKKTSGGYLGIIHFLLGDEKVGVQLEISQREGKKEEEAVTIVNDFIPPYTLIALMRNQLIDEKIQALLSRHKARDYYDLYFILRANLLLSGKKNILSKVLVLLDKTNISFEKKLKQFLPKSHWAIIRNFKETLKKEIARSI